MRSWPSLVSPSGLGCSRARGRKAPGACDNLAAFENALEDIRSEGRYRVFIDVKRYRGEFPKASVRHADGTLFGSIGVIMPNSRFSARSAAAMVRSVKAAAALFT